VSLQNGGLVVEYSSISSGAVSFSLNITIPTLSLTGGNTTITLTFQASTTGENIVLNLDLLTPSNTPTASAEATFSMNRTNVTGWQNPPYLTSFSLSELSPYLSSQENAQSGAQPMQTYEINGVIDRTIIEVFLNGGVDAGTMIFFPTGALDTIILSTAGLDRNGRNGGVDFEAWGLNSGWSSTTTSTTGESTGTSKRIIKAGQGRLVDGFHGAERVDL
jgi:beta-fructofuranosidase